MGTPSYSGSRKGALKPMYSILHPLSPHHPYVSSAPSSFTSFICPISFSPLTLFCIILHSIPLVPSLVLPSLFPQPYPNFHHPLSQINTVPPPSLQSATPCSPSAPPSTPLCPSLCPPPFAPLFPPSAPLCPPLPTQAPPPDLLIAGWFVCREDDKCVCADSYPSLCFFSQLS